MPIILIVLLSIVVNVSCSTKDLLDPLRDIDAKNNAQSASLSDKLNDFCADARASGKPYDTTILPSWLARQTQEICQDNADQTYCAALNHCKELITQEDYVQAKTEELSSIALGDELGRHCKALWRCLWDISHDDAAKAAAPSSSSVQDSAPTSLAEPLPGAFLPPISAGVPSGGGDSGCEIGERYSSRHDCPTGDDALCGPQELVCEHGDLACVPIETICSAPHESCMGVFNTTGLITDVEFGPPSMPDGYDSYFAIADFEANFISVLIQTNMNFRDSAYVTIPVPPGSYVMKTFDIDRSGSQNDLLVVNLSDNAVYPFVYDGNTYTFTARPSLITGNRPVSVDTGDVNNDSYSDIVVVDQDDNTVSVFLNDAGAGFFARQAYDVGVRPTDVVLADFNGDSFRDIAVTNFTSQSLSILLNNGDGTFAPKVDYYAGYRPTAIASGNLDAGGIDLVVVNGGNVGDNSVVVFLNNGDGLFSLQQKRYVGQDPHDVTVTDFNNDGLQDVITANLTGPDISILLGDGTGHLGLAHHYGQGLGASRLLIQDYSYDGLLDVLVVNPGADAASFLYNNGAGGINDAPYPYNILDPFQSGGYGTYDFNNDGLADTVTLDNRNGEVIVTLRESCQRGFGITSRFPAGYSFDYAVGDMNNDGNLDIVLPDNGAFLVFYNDGNANFTRQQFLQPVGVSYSIALADMNLDGFLDVVMTGPGGSDIAVSVFINNLGTSFTYDNSYPAGVGLGIGAIDDQPGPDPAFADLFDVYTGYYHNDGMGGLNSFYTMPVLGLYTLYLSGVIDLNGDNAAEIVLGELFPNLSTIYFNDGVGNFSASNTSSIPLSAELHFADLNNDGIPDMINYNDSTTISVYFNDGSGRFENATQVDYTVPYGGDAVFFMDFDGNGFLDIGYYYSMFSFTAIYNPGEFVVVQ